MYQKKFPQRYEKLTWGFNSKEREREIEKRTKRERKGHKKAD